MSRFFSNFLVFLVCPSGCAGGRAHISGAAGRRGARDTNSLHRRLMPPLRDAQQESPVWLCPVCGAEQYPMDYIRLWHGRAVCALCRARLENEEREELI